MSMPTSDEIVAAVTSVVGSGRVVQPAHLPGETVVLPYARVMPTNIRRTRACDGTWLYLATYFVALCTLVRDKGLELRIIEALDAVGAEYDLSYEYDMVERVFMVVIYIKDVNEVYQASTNESESES